MFESQEILVASTPPNGIQLTVITGQNYSPMEALQIALHHQQGPSERSASASGYGRLFLRGTRSPRDGSVGGDTGAELGST